MSTQTAKTLLVEMLPDLKETVPYRFTHEDLTNQISVKIGPYANHKHSVKCGYRRESCETKPGRLIRQPNYPPDAELHGSFLYTLSNAYSHHQSVSFAPHDLWYVLLTEIARMVEKTPEEFRSIYTKSPEKIEILVPTNDPTYLPLDLIISELTRLVPVDISLFIPEFSTHTDNSRVACMAAFADAAKSFYSYMTFCCGIKSLEVRGTVNDWKMFKYNLGEIKKLFESAKPARSIGTSIGTWLTKVEDRIQNIIDSLNGGDTEFYRDIFSTTRVGSGGELNVNGWFGSEFFRESGSNPKITNYPNTWSLVPFKNVDTGRTFTDAFGCFYSTNNNGMRTPHYDRFTFEYSS